MNKPWSKQKLLQKVGEIPTIEEIRSRILSISDQRDRVFIALTYLTAGRVAEVIPIEKLHISKAYKKNREIIIIRMKNLKNKKRKWKNIPIPFDREGRILVDVLGYIESKEGRVFGFNHRSRGWQIVKKWMGFNPHWLRHLRLTHLVTVYDFNDQELVRFAGWTDSTPAKHYTELRVGDLLEKL